MSVFRSASLYYGFARDFSRTTEKPSKNIHKVNEDLDVTAKKINRSDGNARIVIGKKIELTREGCFQSITASDLLQNITGIEKTEELRKNLEELGMSDQEPRLILCSEVS